jgi:predicted phosphoribosyltransferase
MFSDRFDAARRLSPLLRQFRGKEDVIVLAIPRGGLQTGSQLAKDLGVALDIIIAKKIGAPGNPELAIGAVGSGGVVVLDEEYRGMTGASQTYVGEEVKGLTSSIEEKEKKYRGNRPSLTLKGKTAIITDDGAATGSTVIAAARVARALGAKRVIIALPVTPPDTAEKLEDEADAAFFVETPGDFYAVGQYYASFPQVSDEEALGYLR